MKAKKTCAKVTVNFPIHCSNIPLGINGTSGELIIPNEQIYPLNSMGLRCLIINRFKPSKN